MNDTIKKPLTVASDDFLNNVVGLINNSGLPFFIVENILQDCLREVHKASQQQLQSDKVQYEKLLKEQSEKEQIESEEGN